MSHDQLNKEWTRGGYEKTEEKGSVMAQKKESMWSSNTVHLKN